jgi:hypothetical protein
MLPTIKSVDGVQGVQRVVCGGCLDFKVVTTLPAEKFGAWEETGFDPEAKFLEALGKVEGLTMIETQTYTVRNSVIFCQKSNFRPSLLGFASLHSVLLVARASRPRVHFLPFDALFLFYFSSLESNRICPCKRAGKHSL